MRLTSHEFNFGKAFFQGLKHQGIRSQAKLYRVKQGTDKGFLVLF